MIFFKIFRGKRKKGGKWNREEVFDILKKGKMWKSKRGLVGSYFQSGTGNGRAVIHEKCNFWERSRFSFSLSARVWHPGPGNVAPFWMVPVLVPKKFGPGKKYRSRYRKKMVPEKGSVPVPEKILGTVTLLFGSHHFSSNDFLTSNKTWFMQRQGFGISDLEIGNPNAGNCLWFTNLKQSKTLWYLSDLCNSSTLAFHSHKT